MIAESAHFLPTFSACTIRSRKAVLWRLSSLSVAASFSRISFFAKAFNSKFVCRKTSTETVPRFGPGQFFADVQPRHFVSEVPPSVVIREEVGVATTMGVTEMFVLVYIYIYKCGNLLSMVMGGD